MSAAKKFIVGLSLFALGAASSASAAGLPKHAGKRQDIKTERIRQERKIRKGLASGQLTERQALRLQAEQKQIRRDIKMARADGFMSPLEVQHIQMEQAQANRNIRRAKHKDFRRLR